MSRYDALSRCWSGVIGIGTLSALALMSPLALAAKSDVPPGFGYQTTGGKGAKPIEVSTAADLEKALCDPKKLSGDGRVCYDTTPKIIKIKGIIDYNAKGLAKMANGVGCYYSDEKVCTAKGVSPSKWSRLLSDNKSYRGHCSGHTNAGTITYNSWGLNSLAIGSNTTVMGVGKNSGIKGRGFAVRLASNVVIRNLSITDINENIVFAGDGIEVQDADKVWIDQNRFARIGRQWITVGWGKTTNVTISNNDFDGTSNMGQYCDGTHYFGLIISARNQNVSLVGNWFRHFRGRSPDIAPPEAAGQAPIVHMLNNYFQHGTWHGLAAAKPARVLVEGNYYENVDTPIIRYGSGDAAKNAGYVFAPLATVTSQCQGQLGRVCTANLVFGENPRPSSLPKAQAFTQDLTVLDAMKKAVAASRGGNLKPFPAKNVPRRVMAEAGPQDWLR